MIVIKHQNSAHEATPSMTNDLLSVNVIDEQPLMYSNEQILLREHKNQPAGIVKVD